MLSIHEHAMPTLQPNRRMVRVPHAAANVHIRIPNLRLPWQVPLRRLSRDELAVLLSREPVGITTGDEHRLTAEAAQFLAHMRLATEPTRNGFVLPDESAADIKRWLRNKEPFALSDKGSIAPTLAVTPAKPDTILSVTHRLRLEGFLGRCDVGYTAAVGNTRDKPVPLIMAAKKLVLAPIRIHAHQEQVPIPRLCINSPQVRIRPDT